MSKTDKTHPIWVKLRQDHRARKEFHNHEDGICNFEEWRTSEETFYPWRYKACGYTVNYYGYHGGFFARPPRSKEIRKMMEGMTRASWRAQRDEMLKLSRDDIEDYDVKSYQHRHSALWEMF